MESLSRKIQDSVQTEHDKVLKKLAKLISNKIDLVDSLPFEKSIYDKHLEYGTKKPLTDKYDSIQEKIKSLDEIEYIEKAIKSGLVISNLTNLNLKTLNIKDSDVTLETVEEIYQKINLDLKLVYWGYEWSSEINKHSPYTFEKFLNRLKEYYIKNNYDSLYEKYQSENWRTEKEIIKMLRGDAGYIPKVGYHKCTYTKFDESDIFHVYNSKYNLFFQKISYDYYLLIHTSVNEDVVEDGEDRSSENDLSCENCKNETPRHSILCNSCLNFSNFEAAKLSFFDKVQEHNDFIKQMDEDLEKINETWKK